MFIAVFLLMVGVIAIVEIVKPTYGICFLILMFFLPLRQLYPEIAPYRTNLILSIILLISTFARHIDFRKKEFFLLCIWFVVASGLSGFFAGMSDLGKTYLTEYMKCTLFCFIILNFIEKREDLFKLLNACLVGGVVNAFVSVYMSAKQAGSSGDLYRSEGVGFNANALATLLIGLIPVAYYFFLHGQKAYERRIYLGIIGLFIAGVLATVSRVGFLALIIMGTFIFVKNIKRVSTIVVIAIGVIVFFSFAKELYEQRGPTLSTTASGRVTVEASANYRVRAGKQAIGIWSRHMLLGCGLARFPEARFEYYNEIDEHVVHNVFLQILSEQGLLGFIPFMAIFWLSYKNTVRLKKHEDTFFSELGGYFQISLIGLTLCCMTLSIQRQFLLWVYLTLPYLLDKISRIEASQKESGDGVQTSNVKSL